MIEVRYDGRLGNNMFQYCLGRILAEELGFELQAAELSAFPNTVQRVCGARHEKPEQSLTGQRVDLTNILADHSPRKIILDGFFQSYRLYRPYRARIREWLTFDPAIHVPDEVPEVVVNVRRTDFVQLGWALPFSFYEAALDMLLPRGGKVWIVTDDYRDPFFRNFARWQPIFFNGTGPEQMLFMARCQKLVMSPSTFSWWPTFLGNPQEVVCPLASFTIWGQGCDEEATGKMDLIEHDRFICLNCNEPYQPTKTEAQHQKRRLLWRRTVLSLNRRLHLSLPVPPI